MPRPTPEVTAALPGSRGEPGSTTPRKRVPRTGGLASAGTAKSARATTASPPAGVASAKAAAPAPSVAAAHPTPAQRLPASEGAGPKAAAAAEAVHAGAPAPRRPKLKLVRDSFTIPQADFDLIQVLKERALVALRPAKKSELLRAGLRALTALDHTQLKQALDALEPLKAGRPKKLG